MNHNALEKWQNSRNDISETQTTHVIISLRVQTLEPTEIPKSANVCVLVSYILVPGFNVTFGVE